MEEILASILQGEDASSLYEKYMSFLVTSGYVDYDGVPQRCPICESTHLSREKVDTGKYYIRCDHCNILVAIIKTSENKGEEDEIYEYKSS